MRNFLRDELIMLFIMLEALECDFKLSKQLVMLYAMYTSHMQLVSALHPWRNMENIDVLFIVDQTCPAGIDLSEPLFTHKQQ